MQRSVTVSVTGRSHCRSRPWSRYPNLPVTIYVTGTLPAAAAVLESWARALSPLHGALLGSSSTTKVEPRLWPTTGIQSWPGCWRAAELLRWPKNVNVIAWHCLRLRRVDHNVSSSTVGGQELVRVAVHAVLVLCISDIIIPQVKNICSECKGLA